MRHLATTVVRALRDAEIPTRARHWFVAPDAVALRWASSCVDQVGDAQVANMSDAGLRTELTELGAAPDALNDAPTLARALAIVSAAMQRRLGAWRIFDIDDLPGPVARPIVRCLEVADSIQESDWYASRSEDPAGLRFVDPAESRSDLEALMDSHRLNPGQREIVRGLVYVGQKLRLAQPDQISLPSTFYDAVRDLDSEGSLRFDPTREQIITAALLVRGLIVEMDAGEGKTVSAGLAAAVTAATARTVHVLTANDYLAMRDAEWLAPVYESLGISVDAVLSPMGDDERRNSYAQQVVYTTAREVGFDYLRDNLRLPPERPVQGRLDAAIVDEADHVLIDQNQTPLIISGAEVGDLHGFHRVHQAVRELVQLHASEVAKVAEVISNGRDDGALDAELATLYAADPDNPVLRQVAARTGVDRQHLTATLEDLIDSQISYAYEQRFYLINDARTRSVRYTDRGEAFVARGLGPPADVAARSADSPPPERQQHEALLSAAHQFLQAYTLFKRDVDYVVIEDHVVLVDQLNGRLLPDNRYMHGLQAALEAKEGLPPRPELETLAQTTITAVMGLYPRISGLTGTAVEARDEFMQNYGLRTVRVPPSQESRREDHEPRVFPTTARQQKAVVQEVSHWHSLGRPVLVGTASVQQSQEIGDLLSKAGIRHNLLNAVNSEGEAQIIRDAGRFGAVTVATNMAGRGTDIVLEPGLDGRILKACRRLVEALLSKHQSTMVELRCDGSEEAALVGAALSGIEGATVGVNDGPQPHRATVRVTPGRIEGNPIVLEFGLGLCVVGTALNPTSRVDRQLRGRAGRQGAFGASKLLVSAQDNPIAFSRQASSLAELVVLAPPTNGGRVSSRVARLVRQVQSEGEADTSAASAQYRDYSAVLEAQTREYYRSRRQVFHSEEWFDDCVEQTSRWAGSVVTQAFDQWAESGYVDAFEELSGQLWADMAIDCGLLFGAGRAVLVTELGAMLAHRLDEARSTMGATRFDELSKLALVTASDELWPELLSHLRDVALSNAIYGPTHRVAVTQFTRQARTAYRDFISSAWSKAVPRLLTLHFQERLLSGPDTVIPVQEEILSILA